MKKKPLRELESNHWQSGCNLRLLSFEYLISLEISIDNIFYHYHKSVQVSAMPQLDRCQIATPEKIMHSQEWECFNGVVSPVRS